MLWIYLVRKQKEINMRNDLTEIVVVLDNSGSMASKVMDTLGGLTSFIELQKAQPGEARFTLVEFSSRHNYNMKYNAVPLASVNNFELHPSGNTALFDAIGKTINAVGKRLSDTPEDQRPGLVNFVIITDGEENNSALFTLAQIKEMITHQTEVYKWNFQYLGSNQDAFSVGSSMGLSKNNSANYSHAKNVFTSSANLVSRMRSQSMTGQTIKNEYTNEDRKLMS